MKCWECELETEQIHHHHVVPRSRGGEKTVPLCLKCHAKAHHRDKKMSSSALIREALKKRKKKAKGKYFSGRARVGFHVPHPGAPLQPHLPEWFEVRDWIRRHEAGETQKSIAERSGKKAAWLYRLFKKHPTVESFEFWTACECGFIPTNDKT